MFALLSTTTLFLGLQLASSTQARKSPRVAQAWYAGWHADEFTPSNVSWSKYTHMTYSFAIPTENRTLTLEGSNPEGLPGFVKAAKEHDVKAILSIGGWTGSRFFSTAVGSAENRTAFVKTVTDFAVQNDLDGLDFDWEYPNRQGLGCNIISPNDTQNFILFLEELREHPVGKELSLSSAVSITPFNNATGSPSPDLSRFGKALDFVAIMNYDVWGSWSTSVGPNGPLNDTCAAPANQQGSAVRSVAQWSAAGIPIDKLLLGLPSYGHSFSVNKTDAFRNGSETELAPYPPFNAKIHPTGDRWDDPAGLVDACGVTNPAGGIFNFWGLVEHGYLNKDGSPKLPHRFDECSQTDYVYDAEKEIMVSYDSAKSWASKGKYIADSGLAGFAIWQAGGDYHDILLDSVRNSAGF
ncbi:hypothetical protein V5O48_006609 [Marasmius crinis-equi]|uniref:GH18 domain-containing protein n=1 Tax=Marasmius crinis-equi TaxID=585013 RepID=A0ABR3FJE6_9AGAR